MTYFVVQTAFLGDVLLTLPLCAAIKRRHADARVVLITTPQAASFVKGLDVVDEVVSFDKRGEHRSHNARAALLLSIQDSNGAVALVPHKSMRTMMLVRALHTSRVVTYQDAASRWVATDVVPYPRGLHDALRHLTLLDPLEGGRPALEDLLPISLFTNDDMDVVLQLLPAGAGPLVVLAPGSAWATKQWPAVRYRELAEKLLHFGARVVVLGDASTGLWLKGVPGLTDLSGLTTLRQAAAVIASSQLVVANDSAPVHLASLQQTPVVALFGPTVPEFGFGPIGERTVVVQRHDLACRPCSVHGTRTCPLGTHACLAEITADTVMQAVRTLLHAHDENRNASAKTTTPH